MRLSPSVYRRPDGKKEESSRRAVDKGKRRLEKANSVFDTLTDTLIELEQGLNTLWVQLQTSSWKRQRAVYQADLINHVQRRWLFEKQLHQGWESYCSGHDL